MSRTSHSAHLRDGSIQDADALIALDSVAANDPGRALQIGDWLARGGVQVAEQNGRAVGYLVIHHHFFGEAFVEMLMVAHAQRGQGIGTALLRQAIALHGRRKLFTSTNASNIGMQHLLTAHGFVGSGILHGLDEGAPELIYRLASAEQLSRKAVNQDRQTCHGLSPPPLRLSRERACERAHA